MTPLGGKACVLGRLPSSGRGMACSRAHTCAAICLGPRVPERFPPRAAPLPALRPGSLAATRLLGPAALVRDVRGLKPSPPLIRPALVLPPLASAYSASCQVLRIYLASEEACTQRVLGPLVTVTLQPASASSTLGGPLFPAVSGTLWACVVPAWL